MVSESDVSDWNVSCCPVYSLQLLFDFLAFKNDISFWKKKKSMIGMSTKAGRNSPPAQWLLMKPQTPASAISAASELL